MADGKSNLAAVLGIGAIVTYLGLGTAGGLRAWRQARPADQSSTVFALDIAWQTAIGPLGFFVLAALIGGLLAKGAGKSFGQGIGPGHVPALLLVWIGGGAFIAWKGLGWLTG